jgi:putative membrane protein
MKKLKSITAFAICMQFGLALMLFPAMGQGNPALSDAEVAHTAVTANQIDIDYAKLAKERSKNAEVLKFAETMANDHKAVIDQAVALVTKLGVTPKDNAVSKQLLADAKKTREMLRTKTGAAFDKAYIANEVAYHKAVIGAVEGLLIPESENAELKGLLQSIVPALNAHLEHAQMVQKQFKGNETYKSHR